MLRALSLGLLHLKNFYKKSNLLDNVNKPYYHDKEYVKDFVYRWNLDFPLDRWYRSKYNIAFNSPTHREISVLDIRYEWEEYKLYKEINKPREEYNPKGNFFLKEELFKEQQEITEDRIKEWVDEFKEMDLSQYDD